MFGYVRPLKPEMKVRDFEVFRGMYCGLCHELSRRYGVGTENILSYDLCFLAILIAQANGIEIERSEKHCISSIAAKKPCVAENDALRYAADASVILGYYKAQDAVNDERGIKNTACHALKSFLKPKYKKAALLLPAFDETVRKQLEELSALEKENCDSIDRTADTFAQILSALADKAEDEKNKKILREVLYHTGRWIYILDAADDLEEDIKEEKYNPVYRRFFPCSDMKKVKDEIRPTLYHSLETAASCAELLPEGRFMPIVENILYQGLPAVTEKVLNGTYDKMKFFRGRAEHGSL